MSTPSLSSLQRSSSSPSSRTSPRSISPKSSRISVEEEAMARAAASMAETAREDASTGKAAMGQKAVMAAASTDAAAVSIITKTAAAITAGRTARAPMNRISSRISEKATKKIAWIRKPHSKEGAFVMGSGDPLLSTACRSRSVFKLSIDISSKSSKIRYTIKE